MAAWLHTLTPGYACPGCPQGNVSVYLLMGWGTPKAGGRKARCMGATPVRRMVVGHYWAPHHAMESRHHLGLCRRGFVYNASTNDRGPTFTDKVLTGVMESPVEDFEDDFEDDVEPEDEEAEQEYDLYFEEVEDDITTTVAEEPTPLTPTSVPRTGPFWFWAGIGAIGMLLFMSFWNWLFGKPTPAQTAATFKSAPTNGVSTDSESVEWVNMSWRKIWRVYQRGLERWFTKLLQPVFDRVVEQGRVPRFVQRLKIVELDFDHEAPRFSNLRRRSTRKDSDLSALVDVRYTGAMRMLLVLEVGGGRWRLKVPVLVSDLDLECTLWLKVRLAPLIPYIGNISLAFVAPPNMQVQLFPYNRVRLMRTPVLQNFLTSFLTVDLPGMMVLPKRLDVNIPPAVTAVAEAAVGRGAVLRAVASAVLQADAVEQSLVTALPLGPQKPAGGVTLPESFQGELTVKLRQGRNLPVWGFPWQSNPFCRLVLGKQAVLSKKENETSSKGSHKAPIWNQEFELLLEDVETQVLEVYIKDSHLTGRPDVGKVEFPLSKLRANECLSVWLPVLPVNPNQQAQGELYLDLTYRSFLDDEQDSGYNEFEAYKQEFQAITDVKSAAAASSRAGAAASAAFETVAMARAAAARAANRAQKAALRARDMALNASRDEEDEYEDVIDWDPDTYEPGEVELPYSEVALLEEGKEEDLEEVEEAGEETADEQVLASEVIEADQTSVPVSAYVQEVLEEVKAELKDDSPELVAAVEILGQNGVDEHVYANTGLGSNGNIASSDTGGKNSEEMALHGFQDKYPRLELHSGVFHEDNEEDEETWMDSSVCASSMDGEYELSGVGSAAHVGVDQQPEVRSVVSSGGSKIETTDNDVRVAGPAVVDGNFITQLERTVDGKEEMYMQQQRHDMVQSQNGPQIIHNGSVSPPPLSPQHLTLGDIEGAADALEVSEMNDKHSIEKLQGEEEPQMEPDSYKRSHSSLDSSAEGVGGVKDEDAVVGSSSTGPDDAPALATSSGDRGVKRKRENPRKKGPWWGVLRRFRKNASEQDEVKTGDVLASTTDSGKAEKDSGETTNQQVSWWSWAAALVSRRLQDTEGKEQQRPRKRRRVRKDPNLVKSKAKRGPDRMDRVVIPREIPLEDIAKEVVRLKEESAVNQEEKLDRLYTEAIEESDRKWVTLLCFLTAVSAGLLMIVAHRLDQFQ